MRKNVLALGLNFVAFFGVAGNANADAWDNLYTPDTGERFIPVELWTGMYWDGSRNLAMTKVTPNPNHRVTISGPEDYTRPTTGEVLKVYRRVNKGKIQLFTVTSNKDGIGRVFDSRRNRNCIDEVKFPLGLWRQGETREFSVECQKRSRTMRVTIEEIDFTRVEVF